MALELQTSNDGSIEAVEQIGTGDWIGLRAVDCRRERTGYHAKVAISIGDRVAAYNNFNVERIEERNRLAGATYKQFNELQRDSLGENDLRLMLDEFCNSLEPHANQIGAPTWLAPTKEVTPLHYYLKPYVIQGAGTVLYGTHGKGKSWVALAMTLAIQYAQNRLWPTNPGRVLFINLERSEQSVQRRLGMLAQAHDLEPEEASIYTMSARGSSLAELSRRAHAAIKHNNIEVVVLDSISRAGYGSLTDDLTANKTIDVLNWLCPTWVAIGHQNKKEDGTPFGSIHFSAGADLAVQVNSRQALDGQLQIGMKVTKANDIPFPQNQVLNIGFQEDGINYIRMGASSEYSRITDDPKEMNKEVIYDYLGRVGKATTKEIAEEVDIAQSTVSNYLADDVRLGKERNGREVYYFVKAPASVGEPEGLAF